ncbi:SDR family oxidoreductase [Nonomuraea helvata]|uniref:SDR family oxidoreductase n=1 Tax=Nonomuraea helvata TaxID=37484 RepID=A0ABV5RRC6_9ACTN
MAALRDSQGKIVLIGSEAGIMHRPGNTYSVTKWALTAFAENTRLLVAADGVGVTMVAPGPVDTPFYAAREGGAPGGSILTADTVADAVVWALTQPAGVDVNTIVVRPSGRM